jgi:Fe-S cluster biosynthesis and repair protein YggX
MNKVIKELGQNAYAEGLKLSQCPFNAGSQYRKVWIRAWVEKRTQEINERQVNDGDIRESEHHSV